MLTNDFQQLPKIPRPFAYAGKRDAYPDDYGGYFAETDIFLSQRYGFPRGQEDGGEAESAQNVPPTRGQFNAALHKYTDLLFSLQSGVRMEWRGKTFYRIGAVVWHNNNTWVCAASNQGNTPQVPSDYWTPFYKYQRLKAPEKPVGTTTTDLVGVATRRAAQCGAKLLGDIQFSSAPNNKNPFGDTLETTNFWYLCDGRTFAVGTPQRVILDSLPNAFRANWSLSFGQIPNLTDGAFARINVGAGARGDAKFPHDAFKMVVGGTYTQAFRDGGTPIESDGGARFSEPNNGGVYARMAVTGHVGTTIQPRGINLLPVIFLGV